MPKLISNLSSASNLIDFFLPDDRILSFSLTSIEISESEFISGLLITEFMLTVRGLITKTFAGSDKPSWKAVFFPKDKLLSTYIIRKKRNF